jgi:hypothetical protein
VLRRIVFWGLGLTVLLVGVPVATVMFFVIGTRDVPRLTPAWHGMMHLAGAIRGYADPWEEARAHSVDEGCVLFRGRITPEETTLSCDRFLLIYDEEILRRALSASRDDVSSREDRFRASHGRCTPFFAESVPHETLSAPFGRWTRSLLIAFEGDVEAQSFMDLDQGRFLPSTALRDGVYGFDFGAAEIDLVDTVRCDGISAFLVRAEGRSFKLE